MAGLSLLVRENLRLLEQGRALLRSLERETYARPAPELHLAAAGGHFRHCIDFYLAFLRGVDGGRVDYDARARDAALEQEPAAALERLDAIATALGPLEALDPETVLDVHPECAPTEDRWSESSLARELHFLASHTVHHFALIAVVLRVHGCAPPAELGVAPSTLRHREASGACAP